MKQINWKKLILPNIPYVFIALLGTKLGEAIRLAPGSDLSGKIMHFMEGMVCCCKGWTFHCHHFSKCQSSKKSCKEYGGIRFLCSQA